MAVRKRASSLLFCALLVLARASDAQAGSSYKPGNYSSNDFSFKNGSKTYVGSLTYDKNCETQSGDRSCDFGFKNSFCEISLVDENGRNCVIDTQNCGVTLKSDGFAGLDCKFFVGKSTGKISKDWCDYFLKRCKVEYGKPRYDAQSIPTPAAAVPGLALMGLLSLNRVRRPAAVR